MQTWLFKTLGAIAGLAGIALGVLLVLYRDIIASDLLSKTLCQAQAYNVVLSIIVFVFGIAAVGTIAWLISGSRPDNSNLSTAQVAITSGLIVPVLMSVVIILMRGAECKPVPVGQNTLNIRSAKYAADRNVHGISHVSNRCQSKSSCSFYCDNDHADHGDPKEHEDKQCIILYNCRFTPDYEQNLTVGEGPGRVVSLSCPQNEK